MKKKIIKMISTVLLLVVLAGISAVGTLLFIRHRNVEETGNVFGISWYNEKDSEFTITTKEELYEFAKLSDYYSFEKQTVKLGADIVMNEGNASDWKEDRPETRWKPIDGFAGTFDGQGHTISGLYGKAYGSQMALFTNAQSKCVIKNTRLVNSYFETGGSSGVASFVAKGGGKFCQLYSDAIFSHNGEFCGGIASRITSKATFEECWFDGRIDITEANAGGIVDYLSGNNVNVKHCLFSGSITQHYDFDLAKTGGIIGRVKGNCKVILSDCLSSGTITSVTSKGVGSFIGRSDGNTTLTISDSYVSDEAYKVLIGSKYGTYSGIGLIIEERDLIGTKAYQWTTLDFEKYWAVVDEETPILQCFAEEVPSLAGIEKEYDISWYTPGTYNHVITTARQLYGLYYLSGSDTLADNIIKLGADIVVNEGNAKDWENDVPEKSWYSIQDFSGVFDGQGHTISGLYSESTEYLQGLFAKVKQSGAVRNLKLTNSYFCNRHDSLAGLGSVVGELYGNMDSVYSNAIVVSYANQAGGIIGRSNDNDSNGMIDKVVVSNCWFDGELQLRKDGTMYGGGIVGRMIQGDLDIVHCLNTGTISSETEKSGVHIGGIIGETVNAGTFNLSDSLNAGEIVALRDTCVGSVIGRAKTEGQTVNITNTYATKESYKRTVGTHSAATVNGGVIALPESMLNGYNAYKYTFLDFPNYWAIVTSDTPILQSFSKSDPSVAGIKKMVDTSWYKADAKSMTIDSVEDLYGFAMLSSTTDFKGQTVKLGADLTVNAVDEAVLSAWMNGSSGAENPWLSIGSLEKPFAGTFDGQEHTIRGIYLKTEEQYVGLIGKTTETAVIKNINVKDSYFCSTKIGNLSGLGSIVGELRGTLENVYSNAVVVSYGSQSGGLVGRTYDNESDGKKDEVVIKNCWFDGELYMKGDGAIYGGGILGRMVEGDLKMSSCLNTGTISSDTTSMGVHVAGMIGETLGTGTLHMSDCLNMGDIIVKRDTCVGSVIGRAHDEGQTVRITGTYASRESYKRTVGTNSKATIEGSALQIREAWLEGKTPEQYAATLENMLDMSWYDEKKNEFIIDTKEKFYGFAVLASGYSFEGKTVKLGATMKLDSSVQWLSIGSSVNPFAGTFDGQMKHIQGVQMDTDLTYIGLFGATSPSGILKNFSLKDSTFNYESVESLDSEVKVYLGSVCGDLRGDMENVYSNATVTSTGSRVGGLVASANGVKVDDKYTTSTIQNCWFDGEVKLTGEYARYAAGIAGVAMQGNIEIDNCLNTGSVSNERTTAGQFIGGIIGSDLSKNTMVTIADTLNAGTVTAQQESYNGVAAVVGMLYSDGSIYTLNNVYSVQESCVTPSGKAKSTGYYSKTSGKIVGTVDSMEARFYIGTEGYRWTTLDFKDSWVARTEEVPALQIFVKESLPVTGITRANIEWYDPDKEELYIENESEFYGFAKLVYGGKTFKDQTVYLNGPLELNEVDEETMAEWREGTSVPKNTWVPIGANGKRFYGTFDGQGNTISGVYLSSKQSNTNSQYWGLFGMTHPTSMLKNFRLEDSYFCYASEETDKSEVKAYLGSVCGDLRGDMENVYSNAIIDSKASRIGGLVASANGSKVDDAFTTSSIKNCWFDGEVKLTGKYARYAGGIAGVAMQGTVEIMNCLNTGDVSNERTDGAQFLAGIIGTDLSKNTQIWITDCLNAGDITGKHSSYNGISSIIGKTMQNGTVYHLKGVYSINGTCVMADGTIQNVDDYADSTATTKGEAVSSMDEEYFIGMEGYRYTTFDFTSEAGWVARNEALPAPITLVDRDAWMNDYEGVTRADINWYTEEEILSIEEESEMYGLSKLVSMGYTFEGKTVLLKDGLEFNEVKAGTIAAWSEGTVPKNTWLPIGSEDTLFKGTFDGNKKSIKGLYMSTNEANAGLFGCVSGTICNLALVDSYLESTIDARAYLGSIAGYADGEISKVYSSATLFSNGVRVGGLVGAADVPGASAELDIINCWYNGQIVVDYTTPSDGSSAQNINVGGVVGYIDSDSKAAVDTCLYSGSILVEFISNVAEQSNYGACVGGICGRANSALLLSHSISAGSIDFTWEKSPEASASKVSYLNTVCGFHYNSTEISNTYATTEVQYTIEDANKKDVVVTNATTSSSGNYSKVSVDSTYVGREEELYGAVAYRLQKLRFARMEGDTATPIWSMRTDALPIPTDLKDIVQKLIDKTEWLTYDGTIPGDISWYNADDDKLYIEDEADFLGFAQLVNAGSNFAGKTVYLKRDMTLNQIQNGTIDSWKAGTAAENQWTPIGTKANPFVGTFDGQGNTIYGLYVKENAAETGTGLFGYLSGTVQNVRLKDSYLEDNATGKACLGSIAGYADGLIQNVYSDADLYTKGARVGGLVGMVGKNDKSGAGITLMMKECWYNGAIQIEHDGTESLRSGGLLGYIDSPSGYTVGATIDTCLYSGRLNVSYISKTAKQSTYGPSLGGICGRANSRLTVKHSISAGSVDFELKESPNNYTTKVAYVNTVCGYHYSSTEVSDTYATTKVQYRITYRDNTYVAVKQATTASNENYSKITVDSSYIEKEDELYGAIAIEKLSNLSFTRAEGDTTSSIWMIRDGKLPIPKVLEDTASY